AFPPVAGYGELPTDVIEGPVAAMRLPIRQAVARGVAAASAGDHRAAIHHDLQGLRTGEGKRNTVSARIPTPLQGRLRNTAARFYVTVALGEAELRNEPGQGESYDLPRHDTESCVAGGSYFWVAIALASQLCGSMRRTIAPASRGGSTI